MRKLALIAAACAALLFAARTHAQQIDFALGASTTLSSKYNSASLAYLPPAEKGGNYPSFSVDVLFKNRIGFNGEVAARARQGLYNGYQGFRPVLYDLNAVFAPRLGEKASAEFLAGVGGQSVLFYTRYASCNYPAGCPTRLGSHQLLVHVGGGVRYYVWRHFFVRPEIHYYRINDNTDFNSGNVFRAGASVGYTFRAE